MTAADSPSAISVFRLSCRGFNLSGHRETKASIRIQKVVQAARLISHLRQRPSSVQMMRFVVLLGFSFVAIRGMENQAGYINDRESDESNDRDQRADHHPPLHELQP